MTAESHSPVVDSPKPDASSTVIEEGKQPNEDSKNSKQRIPREKRPNYAQIHAKPLPVEVYPLPAFIPHNPLSIVRLAVALITHSIWPPNSHVVLHEAYFSPETQSIHVTDPKSIRSLWEQGFWGIGSLSRTEPRWLDLEKRKRGLQALQTSEEVTRKRREERRQMKSERAWQELEAREQQLRAEGRNNEGAVVEEIKANGDPSAILNGDVSTGSTAQGIDLNGGVARDSHDKFVSGADSTPQPNGAISSLPDELIGAIEDQEHLQLTLEQAFFLSYALGALNIYKDGVTLPPSYLLRLFCAHSTFPISEKAERHLDKLHRQLEHGHRPTLGPLDVSSIAPDNPFLLKYAVFHHFRSLGWVVFPGIKFGVDYLLYNRGPAFAHAEFAVTIIPSYSKGYASHDKELEKRCESNANRDWWWLHRLNRVQAHVLKTLILVYVEVPSPWDLDHEQQGNGWEIDIGSVLKKYKVREFIVRRWTPNRQRQ